MLHSGLLLFSCSGLTLCDPMDAAHEAPLSSAVSQSWLKVMSIELVMPSNHLILCHLLLLLHSVSPRIFSGESAVCSRWPEYWSFSIRPSNEYSELISFGINWFDILAVQGTLKHILQHPNLKASILQCSAFFMVQLSHPYMTAGKTITLTTWTFVGKMMSLLFNMLSRFVIVKVQLETTRWLFPIIQKSAEGLHPPWLLLESWMVLLHMVAKPSSFQAPRAPTSFCEFTGDLRVQVGITTCALQPF